MKTLKTIGILLLCLLLTAASAEGFAAIYRTGDTLCLCGSTGSQTLGACDSAFRLSVYLLRDGSYLAAYEHPTDTVYRVISSDGSELLAEATPDDITALTDYGIHSSETEGLSCDGTLLYVYSGERSALIPTLRETLETSVPEDDTDDDELGAAGDGYILTTDSVNLRTAPSLDGEIVTSVPGGTALPYLEETETDDRGVDWYRVRYDGSEDCWVSSVYSRPTAEAPASVTASSGEDTVITYGSVHMRAEPSLDGDSLDTLPEGLTLSYLGETSTDTRGVPWYHVRTASGTEGWVSGVYSGLNGSAPASAEEEVSGSDGLDALMARSVHDTEHNYLRLETEAPMYAEPDVSSEVLGRFGPGSITYCFYTYTDAEGNEWHLGYSDLCTGWLRAADATPAVHAD